jgi:hypothetical protein
MMPEKLPVIHSDPEILSGTPVFVGTRVARAQQDLHPGGHGKNSADREESPGPVLDPSSP